MRWTDVIRSVSHVTDYSSSRLHATHAHPCRRADARDAPIARTPTVARWRVLERIFCALPRHRNRRYGRRDCPNLRDLSCLPVNDREQTCVVLLLGYPGVGKRTVGSHLADLLDGVLVDNQLYNLPIFTVLKSDGRGQVSRETWHRIRQVRDAVLETIEELAPQTISYVFTTVLEDDAGGASLYARFRSLAQRRGSLFLAVQVECDVSEEIKRVDAPDRVQRLKWSDAEAVERYRHETRLFHPPPGEVLYIDTTKIEPRDNAKIIFEALRSRMTP